MARGRCSSIGLLIDGIALHDPNAVVARLTEGARLAYDRGPRVSEYETTLRRLAADLLGSARDVHARDPLTSLLLASAAVKEAMALSYPRSRQWTPRDKDIRAGIADLNPAAVGPLAAYAENPSPDTAAVVLGSLIGATGFFEWESQPEGG